MYSHMLIYNSDSWLNTSLLAILPQLINSNSFFLFYTHTRSRRSQRQIEIPLWTIVWWISGLSHDPSLAVNYGIAGPFTTCQVAFFFLPSFPSLAPLLNPADINRSSPNHPQATLCASNAFLAAVLSVRVHVQHTSNKVFRGGPHTPWVMVE